MSNQAYANDNANGCAHTGANGCAKANGSADANANDNATGSAAANGSADANASESADASGSAAANGRADANAQSGDRPRLSLPEQKAQFAFATQSPEETRAFGASLARRLQAGDFIALDGDLAAGKTCLVQGLAAGLGYPGQVTSPTFTLLHLYEGGRLPLYHFDAYRLAAPEELEGLGYEEYFYGDGVCVVEWSDLVAGYLPERRIGITLAQAGAGDTGQAQESANATSAGQATRLSTHTDPDRRDIIVTLYGGSEAWRQSIGMETWLAVS